jgi:DNA-binding transcriptional LysR family regulator
MDIWQMRYFIQTYEDKSFTRAAQNLYITQQGLSKTIKNIENEFQIPLFERTGKGVIPTVYGKIMLEKSKRILNEYDDMVNALFREAQISNKSISIGIETYLYTSYLKNIIYIFQEKHPDISLEFFELGYYSCEKYLEDNLIDICFTVKPESTAKFDFIPISIFKLKLLTNKSSTLAQRDTVTIEDLKEERFIMPPQDTKVRRLTIDRCTQSGFHPNIVITTSQLDFIIELISLDKGIAVLPEFNMLKVLKTGSNVAVIPFRDSLLNIEVGFIIHKNHPLSIATNTLIDYFLQSISAD